MDSKYGMFYVTDVAIPILKHKFINLDVSSQYSKISCHISSWIRFSVCVDSKSSLVNMFVSDNHSNIYVDCFFQLDWFINWSMVYISKWFQIWPNPSGLHFLQYFFKKTFAHFVASSRGAGSLPLQLLLLPFWFFFFFFYVRSNFFTSGLPANGTTL